jgi:hypothetical protein
MEKKKVRNRHSGRFLEHCETQKRFLVVIVKIPVRLLDKATEREL